MNRSALAPLVASLLLPTLMLAAPPTLSQALPASAATTDQDIERNPSGIRIRTANGILTIEPRSERIIHVRFGADRNWTGNYNPAVIAKPAVVSWTLSSKAGSVILATSALQVSVDKTSGRIEFLDKDGKPVLKEAGAQPRTLLGAGKGTRQVFALPDDEAVYGLGQHQSGYLDYRSNIIRLQQANRDVGVPMLMSSRGYGVLWNNAAVTDVDVSIPQSPHQLVFRSEAGAGIDYHFIYGPSVDGVIAGYRELTGTAPMMARWTWGLWQSKERYQTQQELLDIARRHRSMGIPLDAVVQDWQYWRPGGWGSHEFDPVRFPDPAGMVSQLHGLNTRVIISVWPRFDIGLQNLAELDQVGGAFPTVYPNVYPAGTGRWYDAWSATGREVYWKQIQQRLGRLGFDGWWLDGSELELGGEWGQLRQVQTAAGPGAEVYNSFPLLHTSAVHDGAKRDHADKRVFILTRSAYAGQQRNGAITWSGDTLGNWDTFARQIPAGLNFVLSGLPYWSADIGGFFGGKPSDPAYAELFTRWYQFGVFNPMFRVHGTGEGKELWRFPAATQRILLDYNKLRYRLLPYIY